MDYIIGVDTGTSNTKAIAFSANGDILAEASFGYSSLSVTDQGYNEQDPEILFTAMTTVITELISQKIPGKLSGISFSSAMHSLIVMSEDHRPLTNVITWADLRSTNEANGLKDTPEGIGIYNRTGTPVHPMSPLCKILWIRKNDPELFSKAAKFISIKEYFFLRLFGKYVIDYSIASATGMFDIRRKAWDEIALQTIGIRKQQLSAPVSPYTQFTELTGESKNTLIIEDKIPFIIGASDGCLANLGSSAIHPGDVSLTIGTSGAVRMLTREPQPDAGRRIFNYLLDDELYISGGPINNGGFLLKWYSTNFLHKDFNDTSDFEWFVEEASKVEAGCEGLVFLPYIQGERAPVWDANAKGVLIGLHGGHTQPHIMRAIVEGICFSLYEVAASLEETVGTIKNIYASGGFIRSRKWLQILADIFDKPIRLTNASDASAVGAAIVGLKSLGHLKHLHDAEPFFAAGDVVSPHRDTHEVYMKNYRIYSALYQQVKSAFHYND